MRESGLRTKGRARTGARQASRPWPKSSKKSPSQGSFVILLAAFLTPVGLTLCLSSTSLESKSILCLYVAFHLMSTKNPISGTRQTLNTSTIVIRYNLFAKAVCFGLVFGHNNLVNERKTLYIRIFTCNIIERGHCKWSLSNWFISKPLQDY